MKLAKFLSILPKHPKHAYEDAIIKPPIRGGIYLACEVYDGVENKYRLIFMDNLQQLINFIPILLLSHIALIEYVKDNHLIDYAELFSTYKRFINLKVLSEEAIKDLEGDYTNIKIINLGFIETFFDLPIKSIKYIRKNPILFDYEKLDDLRLNMSEYAIISNFIRQFDENPSELPAEFLEYISSLNNL